MKSWLQVAELSQTVALGTAGRAEFEFKAVCRGSVITYVMPLRPRVLFRPF